MDITDPNHIFSFVTVLYINFFVPTVSRQQSGIRGLSGRATSLVLVSLFEDMAFFFCNIFFFLTLS